MFRTARRIATLALVAAALPAASAAAHGKVILQDFHYAAHEDGSTSYRVVYQDVFIPGAADESGVVNDYYRRFLGRDADASDMTAEFDIATREEHAAAIDFFTKYGAAVEEAAQTREHVLLAIDVDPRGNVQGNFIGTDMALSAADQGVVAGLLLPAIQKCREAAARIG